MGCTPTTHSNTNTFYNMTPKEKYIKSLKDFIKKNPNIYGLNTKDFEALMTDIAGVESSYRANVVGKTKSGKTSKYNGYYALQIPPGTPVEEQHRLAFKHLSNLFKHNITDMDVYRAKQLHMSEAQLVGKYWNQGNRVTNYLWNGTDTTDGNGIKISDYGVNHGDYKITSEVNILPYVSEAISDPEYVVKKGDTFSNIQEKIRTPNRNYNTAGKDIKGIKGNKKINPNNLKIGQIIQTTPERDIQSLIYPSTILQETPKGFPTRAPFKKFGGHLKYGWGGFTTPFDIAKKGDFARESIHGYYGRHSVNYYVDKEGYDPNMIFYMDYPHPLRSYNDLTDAEKAHSYNGMEAWLEVGDYDGSTIYTLSDRGREVYDKARLSDQSIYANMQDKIDQDVAKNQQLNTNIARFGGLMNLRRKYPYGGVYSQSPYSGYLGWGTKVKSEDISYTDYNANNEGIVGSEIGNKAAMVGGIGAGIGTAAGAVAGTAAGAWGGPIGMLAGAALGAIIGAITGTKKKNEEEQRRKDILAENKEDNRQNTISNMQYRQENDVAKIRTFNNNMSFDNNSFYGKFGGMLTRRKLEYGGHIIPNSTNTSVAYGRTHDQINPQTGMTGVTYGDAEVEGGGFVNGQEYAGEVIRNTPMGDQIFSNSLPMPGVRATYAQVAKALTDKKGKLEKEIESQKEAITASQEIFNKAKLSKAKAGTSARNIEKQATLLNRKVGELAEIESQLDQTFASQEELATGLGLRQENGAYAKYGGYRPKYAFGYNEASLVGNIGIAGLNILANELTGRSNLKQLEFMHKLQTPKQAHVEAEYYNTDYDISNEIAMAAAQYNRNRRFITDNASNAQILRNAIRKSDIDFLSGYNELKSAQKKYQTERFDLNRNARVQANNMNRQIDYTNLIADYNKNMDYYQAVMGVKNQLQQNRMATFSQLGEALSSYASTKMQEGLWPEGVKDDMYGIKTLSKKDVVKADETILGVPMYNRKGKKITNKNGNLIYLPAGTKVQGRMYYDTKTRSWKPIRTYGV